VVARSLTSGRTRRRGWRPWYLLQRRVLPSQPFLLLALTAVAVGVAFLNTEFSRWVPVTSMILVMLVGGFFLRIRALVLLYLVVAAGLL
jgi:hypothetical protein